jgi:hypothetical protein
MHPIQQKNTLGGFLASAAILLTLGMVISGCNSSFTGSDSNQGNLITNTTTSVVPTTITDAPSDQILAASLTLNSVILTDSNGKVTTNLLPTGGITFEASHLDAVQEPMFSPAIPQDTYVSVALVYSNAQVAYLDPTTHTVDLVTGTLANTSQTISFTTPITVSNSTTSLLVDFLVAQSVAINGSTVTVTPTFSVVAVGIPNTPTNGTNGLMTHRGVVSGINAASNSFTLKNPMGNALTIYVSPSTVYQGIANFAALDVNAVVEVDTLTQNGSGTLPKGSLLAIRMEVHDPGTTPKKLLLGPVTAVTGTPATAFSMVLREQIATSSTTLDTVNVSVNGSTNFLMPQRLVTLASAASLPFTPSFTASTMIAGQHVGVITSNYNSSAKTATATSVLLEPQTIDGAISNIALHSGYDVYTLTLPADHWLAKLTGKTTVYVYTNSLVIPINSTAPTASLSMRFNGFLFNDSGTLRMLACVQADPPGTPIGPHI